jgi:hypothetical protein
MTALNLKPAGAAVKKYYATLDRFARGRFDKEGNIRGAFEDLLKHCARQFEWVIDQYCVSKDARSGIVNDPNREDDPEYIVRLIGQVVTVSLETVRLVGELAALALLPESPA